MSLSESLKPAPDTRGPCSGGNVGDVPGLNALLSASKKVKRKGLFKKGLKFTVEVEEPGSTVAAALRLGKKKVGKLTKKNVTQGKHSYRVKLTKKGKKRVLAALLRKKSRKLKLSVNIKGAGGGQGVSFSKTARVRR